MSKGKPTETMITCNNQVLLLSSSTVLSDRDKISREKQMTRNKQTKKIEKAALRRLKKDSYFIQNDSKINTVSEVGYSKRDGKSQQPQSK